MKRIGQRRKSKGRKIDGPLFFIMDNCWPAQYRVNVTHALNSREEQTTPAFFFLTVLKLFSFHGHHTFYHSVRFHYGCVNDFRQRIKRLHNIQQNHFLANNDFRVSGVRCYQRSLFAPCTSFVRKGECFSCSRSPCDTRDISKESYIKFWPTWKGVCRRPV